MSDNLSHCPTRGWHELGRKRPQCTGQQFVHERLLARASRGPLWKRNRSRTQAPLTDLASAANRRPGTGFEHHDEPQEIHKCGTNCWSNMITVITRSLYPSLSSRKILARRSLVKRNTEESLHFAEAFCWPRSSAEK